MISVRVFCGAMISGVGLPWFSRRSQPATLNLCQAEVAHENGTLPIRLRAKSGQTHYRWMAVWGSIHNGLWHRSALARNRIGRNGTHNLTLDGRQEKGRQATRSKSKVVQR